MQVQLCLYIEDVHFTLSGNTYIQFDEAGMSSPLGPLFSNVFKLLYKKHITFLVE